MRSLSVNYDSGASHSSHIHEWGQLLYAESGAIRTEIDNSYWLVPTRRAMWIPALLPHANRMLGYVRLRTIYVSPDIAPRLNRLHVVNVSGLLHEAILRICELHALDARVSHEMRLADLVMDELDGSTPAIIQLPKPTDSRALQLVNLFVDEERAGSTLPALFEQAGLSRRTAERLFYNETGLSPARWRRFFLLSRAIELLDQGMTIDEVAECTGYKSRSACSQAFKQLLGATPGAKRVAAWG